MGEVSGIGVCRRGLMEEGTKSYGKSVMFFSKFFKKFMKIIKGYYIFWMDEGEHVPPVPSCLRLG
jgi:hypothetical protein